MEYCALESTYVFLFCIFIHLLTFSIALQIVDSELVHPQFHHAKANYGSNSVVFICSL